MIITIRKLKQFQNWQVTFTIVAKLFFTCKYLYFVNDKVRAESSPTLGYHDLISKTVSGSFIKWSGPHPCKVQLLVGPLWGPCWLGCWWGSCWRGCRAGWRRPREGASGGRTRLFSTATGKGSVKINSYTGAHIWQINKYFNRSDLFLNEIRIKFF